MVVRSEIDLREKLHTYHKQLGIHTLDYQSPISGMQFQGEFNVSGYHREVQQLVDGSFWGIDRCLRLQEEVDGYHSNVFHMGIYAKGTSSSDSNPLESGHFKQFQSSILDQFIDLLTSLGIDPKNLEATYLERFDIGGQSSVGRDRALKRTYRFQTDNISKLQLENRGVTCYPLRSIQNIDIHPFEMSLVGPRVEVARNGVEFATIVYDCFRIHDGELMPTNYIGGYALGVERLFSTLNEGKEFIEIFDRYSAALEKLAFYVPVARSQLHKTDALTILFGAEALLQIRGVTSISRGQKKTLAKFKKKLDIARQNLGLSEEEFNAIVDFYQLV